MSRNINCQFDKVSRGKIANLDEFLPTAQLIRSHRMRRSKTSALVVQQKRRRNPGFCEGTWIASSLMAFHSRTINFRSALKILRRHILPSKLASSEASDGSVQWAGNSNNSSGGESALNEIKVLREYSEASSRNAINGVLLSFASQQNEIAIFIGCRAAKLPD